MRYFLILCFLASAVCGHATEPSGQIFIKSATQSFTHEYEVTVYDGKIWHRSGAETAAPVVKWKLLGKTGLPHSPIGRFRPPETVSEISADGDNLIAVGNDGVIYYMKWSTRRWTNQWGMPVSRKLRLPPNIRSWAISHRGPLSGGYSDIDGNFHPISVGVTTLYILSGDGLTIRYADPWLPADFSQEICTPLRNRFRARALAASASTLFIINDAGQMYTRLADFDSMGHNPFLAYSYDRKLRDNRKEKNVRTLPPEEWKKQPSIDTHQGRITSAITIFQTGRGNDARELRVEGVNRQGISGFFSKPIHGQAWRFTETGLPLQKPLLPPPGRIEDNGPNRDRTLLGVWSAAEDYNIKIKNFNPPCHEAALAVFSGAGEWEFPLFITASSQADRRMKGAVLLDEKTREKATENKTLQAFIETVFGGNRVANIRVTIDSSDKVLIEAR